MKLGTYDQNGGLHFVVHVALTPFPDRSLPLSLLPKQKEVLGIAAQCYRARPIAGLGMGDSFAETGRELNHRTPVDPSIPRCTRIICAPRIWWRRGRLPERSSCWKTWSRGSPITPPPGD